jgi:hypothetical protein
MIHSNEEKSKN